MPLRRKISLALIAVLAVITFEMYFLPGYSVQLPKTEEQVAQIAAAQIAEIPQNAPLSLIVEPDDGVGFLKDAIAGANHSIDLVIYELEDPAIEQMLADAEARGVQVRVILENLNSFGRHPNQDAYDFLEANNVPVVWAQKYFTLTHQKTLVVDGMHAFIMTFNLTPQYYASSRDFALDDVNANDISAIETTFNNDWNGKKVTADTADDLVWSPGSSDVLLNLIAMASSTLDIYNEEMADPRITSALEDAAKRGVEVRVVMTYATNWKPPLNELTQNGITVRTYASTAKFYIHAKAIIADGTRAFVGSENFSIQSLDNNRELGILISRPDILSLLEATFQHDFSAARPYKVLK